MARPQRTTRLWQWLGRHRLLVLAAVVAALVVWLVVAGIHVLDAKHSLDRAVDRLEAAELKLTPGEIVDGRGGRRLALARRDFEAAYANLDSAYVAPLRLLPVVGRQVTAVRAMSGSAAQTVTAAERARRQMRAVLDEGWEVSGDRVASMRAVGRIADRTLSELRTVDLGPRAALIEPVADARERFREKLGEARQLLRKARSVAAGMATFLEGPTRYLVLAANNAEMRAGSGMILHAGIITAERGRIVQESMEPTAELVLPPGAVTMTPGDLADRWGWLLPNEDWRNLASSPDFPGTASLAREMWRAETGEIVDGVLLLDPIALEALLATTGPIIVDGTTLDADNVVQYILHDQYAGVEVVEANDARRDRLGVIANAALQQFDNGGWQLSTLLDELTAAVDGRHMLAWSPHVSQNRAWRAAGVSGRLTSDAVMVSVMNFGGNKLDPYIDVDATLQRQVGPEGTKVRIEIALHNGSRLDDAGYVLGLSSGSYPGILAVDVPGYSIAPRLEGVDRLVAAGPEGPATVLAGLFRLERGESKTFVVTFTMPTGRSAVNVHASARYPGVDWSFGALSWTSGETRRIQLLPRAGGRS